MNASARQQPPEEVIKPALEPRYYQVESLEALRALARAGQQRALLVQATGCGKTFTALLLVQAVIRKGGRVLWIAHRTELVSQPVNAWNGLEQFAETGRAGIVQGSANDVTADLVCCSTATIARKPLAPDGRLAQVMTADAAPIRLIIIDEAHHYADDGRGLFARLLPAIEKWAETLGWPTPFVVGLTATPERNDRRGIGRLWGDGPAYVYSYDQAISDGYLVRPRFILDRLEISPEAAALIEEAREGGDDAARELARQLLDEGLCEWTAAAMGRHLRGRRVLVFTCDLEQAGIVRDLLRDDGWTAAIVSGSTPPAQRRRLLRLFSRGDIEVLVNCNVLTEGTDLPCCDALVLARPFSSKVLFIQAVGRALRLYPGKEDALVLDILGASEEHSLVHAAGMLDGEDVKLEAFAGKTVRRLRVLDKGGEEVDTVPIGVWVKVNPRKRVPKEDDRLYEVVSIIEHDFEKELAFPVPVARPRDVKQDGEPSGIRLPDHTKERKRVRARWLPIPDAGGRVLVADIGEHGRVWLASVGGGWMAYRTQKRQRKPRPLGRAVLDHGYAEALGDDLFRQASKLVDSSASWREASPTPGQRRVVEQYGMEPADDTRGGFADAITLHFATQWFHSNGHKFAEVLGLDEGAEACE